MKKNILILFVLLSAIGYTQNGINYKALIKDANGNILSNSNVDVQIGLKLISTLVYVETHSLITDSNGLIILNIGEGTVVSGDFNDIDWKYDKPDLNVQIDIGNGYVDLGDTEFKVVPYAMRALKNDGLEALNEGNGFGWRLSGRDADNYGDIGDNAVDLSISNSASTIRGATGIRSIAMGSGTTASGSSSTVMGSGTTASGFASTAMGRYTNASGDRSTAMGYVTEASGGNSTAMGYFTNSESFASTAIGSYNIGGGNPNTWIDTDPLFEIGNGTSDSNRSNALTVYKDGRHYINSSSRGLTVNADDDGIVVYADGEGANISGDNLGIYANGGQFQAGVPDIILGSFIHPSYSDEGIISTNPERSSSDMFLRSYDDVVVQLDYDNNEVGNFRIRNGSGYTVFDVNESGNVDIDGRLLIGTETIEDTGSNQLSVDASLIPNTNNAFRLGNSSNRWIGVWAIDGTINTSDRRSKTNIVNLEYGLKEVLKLKPVSFNWKTNPNHDTKLGLIAQDLLEVIPEVVKTHDWETDENGNKIKKELERMGVYYSDLVPVLINAIQEQNKIIENQGNALKTSKNNYEALLSRIEQLEVNTSN